MEKMLLQLQARIYWRSLRWFKSMKWPSANEIDFGDFLVVYDFKKGVIELQFAKGGTEILATFPAQKSTREVSEIRGDILCDNHVLQLQRPLVSETGVVQIKMAAAPTEKACGTSKKLLGNLKTGLVYGDKFSITPIIDGRDVFLRVDTSAAYQKLAILTSSLLVFQRFAASE